MYYSRLNKVNIMTDNSIEVEDNGPENRPQMPQ